MKAPGEKISLLVMRDNGEVRSVRMRRSLLVWLIFFCLVMPFIAGSAGWFGFATWAKNKELQEQVLRLSQENQLARAKAERLSNLEQLLQRNAAVENRVVANVNNSQSPKDGDKPVSDDEEKAAAMQEGPGHSEFPAINSEFITVDNINVRLMPGNKLRISLDLRNPDPRKVVSGAVTCTLTSAAGESLPLLFRPTDAGDFRIARLKRAVLLSPLPPQINAADGQVVVEVKSDNGEVIYRNVFPVER